MRIAASIGSEAVGLPVPPGTAVAQAEAAERDGFASAWCVHFSRGLDALSVLAVAAGRTTRIELGVGVVPTYPRHPAVLAQQAATVQALAGGRLSLGIGVSHRPVIEGLFGLAYAQPVRHLREYLSVLGPLLHDGRVSYRGEFYNVEAEINTPGTSPVPLLVGGLSAGMVRTAGMLADGLVTWLAGRRSLESEIGPTLRDSAAEAGRTSPRLVAAVPVAVCDDPAEGRAAAETVFARYAALANYERQFGRDGVRGPAELAVVGPASAVEETLKGYASAGVTEVWAIAFPVGDDAGRSLERTRHFLAGMAGG